MNQTAGTWFRAVALAYTVSNLSLHGSHDPKFSQGKSPAKFALVTMSTSALPRFMCDDEVPVRAPALAKEPCRQKGTDLEGYDAFYARAQGSDSVELV